MNLRRIACAVLAVALCCTSVTAQAVPNGQADPAAEQTQIAALLAASKAHPTDALPLARLGLLEARSGQYPEAIAHYRAALARNPALPGLRLNLGLALFKNGEYRAALDLFQQLEAQDAAEQARLTFLIGMCHYGLGDYAAAVPFLQQATATDPDNQSLLLTLAHSCLQAKQYPCVLDSYHRMIAHNAESAEADMLVGEAMDAMHDTPEAIREFRAAARANPKEPNVHFGLGYLLWTQLQLDEAAAEFRAELANTPDHPQAMLYLADAEIRQNQPTDARTLLEKVLQNAPDTALAHFDLGVLDERDGQTAKALAQYKAAAALSPDDTNVHLRLGRLYRTLGKPEESKAEFLKVKQLTEAANATLTDVMPAQH